MLSLTEHLERFLSDRDLDTPNAVFIKNLPWIGPDAYLNVLYKPVASEVVAAVGEKLQFPDSLREFYKSYNGARLFFDSLRVYGCLAADTLLDRSAPLTLPPFDIAGAYEEFQRHTRNAGIICIGSYGYDRSMVCMDRNEQSVICFKGTDFAERRGTWTSLTTWLNDELNRLGWMFSTDGRRLVEEQLTLPGTEQSRQ
jgi:hypothetical protein